MHSFGGLCIEDVEEGWGVSGRRSIPNSCSRGLGKGRHLAQPSTPRTFARASRDGKPIEHGQTEGTKARALGCFNGGLEEVRVDCWTAKRVTPHQMPQPGTKEFENASSQADCSAVDG